MNFYSFIIINVHVFAFLTKYLFAVAFEELFLAVEKVTRLEMSFFVFDTFWSEWSLLS